MHNLLIINLQTWRANWLVTLLGNAWAPVLALSLLRHSDAGRLLLCAPACNAVETWFRAPPIAGTVIAVLAMVVFLWERYRQAGMLRLMRLAAWMVALTAAVLPLVEMYLFLPLRAGSEGWPWTMLRLGTLGGALALLLSAAVTRARRRHAIPAGAAALVLVAAILGADRRQAWQHFIESSEPAPGIEAFLAGLNTVYWEEGQELLWIRLRRPSYYTCHQGSGVMFFRATALEFARRSAPLSGLNSADFADSPTLSPCYPKREPRRSSASASSRVQEACRALSELDAIVLMNPVPGAEAARWEPPAMVRHALRRSWQTEDQAFHLFRCDAFR